MNLNLIEAAVAVFVINIPFGYWRGNVEKLSRQWFLAVHVPVPMVIAIRFLSGLGWSILSFPVLIAAFFTGQFAGGRIHRFMEKRCSATSCLVMDVIRNLG
ncbi:hypothetical protein [Archaeoglobus neptunius]|uniref:hypothetical protein n=1 Tax=Archaeoglobus neptunius TaxID=2798580 RepID=UPI001925965B